jgi:hypothetical protein
MLGCEFIVSGEGWREELREGQPRRRAEVGVGVGNDELLESRGGGRGSGGIFFLSCIRFGSSKWRPNDGASLVDGVDRGQ